MNNKPDNFRDMVYRALAAQAELGVGEVVMSSAEVSDSRHTAQILSSGGGKSTGEATTLKAGPGDSFQSSLSMDSEPRYGSLDEHLAAMGECQQCPLGQSRNKLVYGVGSPNAGIMFVGEAPGAEEDRRGEPFVGRAGLLLDKILAAMKLSRQDVYIANVLKCRPPDNRDPQPDEMEKCLPHLRQQVRLIKPKLMCALGRVAAQALLKTTTPLGRLRGSWHSYEGIPMLVSYHPAALLRFQKYKKDTWEDMQMLMARYESMK